MKITKLEPLILHAPVTRRGIADSTHKLTPWGAPSVAIHTDGGLVGYGFSGTHAPLQTDRLIVDCIVNSYGPLLVGEDPHEVRALWEKLHKQSVLGRSLGHHSSGPRSHRYRALGFEGERCGYALVEVARWFGFKKSRGLQHRRRMAQLAPRCDGLRLQAPRGGGGLSRRET